MSQRLQKDQTFLTRSLSMSLKSFPGDFEEMDVPKKIRDDVRWLGEPLGSFTIFFSQSDISNHFKEYGSWEAVFGLQDPLN